MRYICIFVIAAYYVHPNEINIEYLQDCTSTIAIMIDILCLYLSCRLSTRIYDVMCQCPHQKCCVLLCTQIVRVRFKNESEMAPIQQATCTSIEGVSNTSTKQNASSTSKCEDTIANC